MAIKAVIDKLEDVPEQYRDLYKEKNGKFEITEVEGIKTEADVTRLSSALEKERNDHKGTKKKFEAFGDRKPEDILVQLDRIAELEALNGGKLDDEKIDKIVQGRIKTQLSPLERKLAEATKGITERDGVIEGFKTKETARTITDAIRDAVSKTQGFNATALEDAISLGERHLTVTEDGKVVTRDNLVQVGVTPGVDAVVWLTDMQAKRPHWWGTTSGGGAGGNNGRGGTNGANPWAADTWNMTEQARMYKENPTRSAQLATAAGTKIGGMKPAARK